MLDVVANARQVLIDILDDENLDFAMRQDDFGGQIPTSPVKQSGARAGISKVSREPLPQSRWNYAVKLFLVRDLFTIASAVFPSAVFGDLAEGRDATDGALWNDRLWLEQDDEDLVRLPLRCIPRLIPDLP